MLLTVEVEIDAEGAVHPVASTRLPQGKAILIWEAEDPNDGYLLSESSLAKDWLTPEEDEAWAHLQPVK